MNRTAYARLRRIEERLRRMVYNRPAYAATATRRLRQACHAHDAVRGKSDVCAVLLWRLGHFGLWITPTGGI